VLGSIFFLVVLVAIMLCAAREELARLPLLLTAALAAAPAWLIALYGLRYAVERDALGGFLSKDSVQTGVWLAILCWGLVAVMRAVAISLGRPRLRELTLVIAVASVYILAAESQYLSPDLFYVAPEEEFPDFWDIDQEEVFYRQPELLASKVASLAMETPDQTDIYFLGFAGNGDQTLFRREARFAQDLLDRSFGTSNRSMVLVNDLKNLQSEPFANRHNLQKTLAGMGQKMDIDDDVLFLFLTSHGSEDAALQVSLYPFELESLRANQLRDYLDQSGIQWRVIVISACYSGSFIDALADEQTLILTAASAEDTSFGCSDERELTYFGEAFFKEALSAKKDIAAAFADAKQAIEKREQEEGIDPSHPQIRMGERIAQKLQSMGLTASP